jgi:hypothetical protein
MTSGRTHSRDGASSRAAGELWRQVSQQVKDGGGQVLRRQKRRVAAELNAAGTSLRQAAAPLRDGPLGPLAEHIESAGERVSRAAWRLEDESLEQLLSEAQAVLRRYPEPFLAGMFVAGFALARLLKASGAAAGSEAVGNRRNASKRRKESDHGHPIRRRP